MGTIAIFVTGISVAFIHQRETTVTTVNQSVNRLDDQMQPWTLTVLGDSTGNEATEWVRLLVRRLAAATGRPAIIHTWSTETDSYEGKTELPGNGEPIVVWNGSAPGRNAAYSFQHINTMAPEPSDLVIINHGHNQVDANEAVVQIEVLISRFDKAWDKPSPIAIVLQNPSTNERAARQASNVQAIRDRWMGAEKVLLIDAYTAFKSSQKIDELLRADKLHPSEDGSQLWSDTAWKSLNLSKFEN